VIIKGIVEDGLAKGCVILGGSSEGTEVSWTDSAGKVAENVAEGKDQQDNAVISIGFVEDLLVIVILGKGDKEAGWAGTARKLAENVEPGEHDNVEIDWGVVEVSVEIVILGDTEAGWTETARKLAEDVEEWTGKIPSRCIYNYF